MKMDGIIDAYVGNTTVIHMSSKDKIAPSEVQSLLDKEQVKISDMKRDDSMVL